MEPAALQAVGPETQDERRPGQTLASGCRVEERRDIGFLMLRCRTKRDLSGCTPRRPASGEPCA